MGSILQFSFYLDQQLFFGYFLIQAHIVLARFPYISFRKLQAKSCADVAKSLDFMMYCSSKASFSH